MGKELPKRIWLMEPFTADQAKKEAHISQPTLSRWVQQGLINRIARGLYLHPKSKIAPEMLDFIIACAKFAPKATIGGLTALYHYGLINQPPGQVWVLVPAQRVNRDPKYRCLRTTMSFQYGIVRHHHYNITNIERTLLEAMKYATKIGERTAIQATRRALNEGLTTEVKLGKMATTLKLRRVLEKYWEAIVA